MTLSKLVAPHFPLRAAVPRVLRPFFEGGDSRSRPWFLGAVVMSLLSWTSRGVVGVEGLLSTTYPRRYHRIYSKPIGPIRPENWGEKSKDEIICSSLLLIVVVGEFWILNYAAGWPPLQDCSSPAAPPPPLAPEASPYPTTPRDQRKKYQ